MIDRDSSNKKSGNKSNILKTKGSSDPSNEMDEKIKSFGIKVSAFIDQLQETGEDVFTQEKTIQELTSKMDIGISEKKDLLDKIEFLKKDRVELESKYKEIVQLLEEENTRLKSDNEKIKKEMMRKVDKTPIDKVEAMASVEEVDEVTILNHFHPSHWDKLIDLNERNKLTLPILSTLWEMQETHLIILALKLEVDHSHCFEVINELEEMGIIVLKQKIAGGLNPLIKLKEYT
ncbi:MAG: hypothetical protein HeimC2_07370 [Candidatus Heimdallarchaeota archaeon LC_2]|nr:MAG: hypothetical protein HeimC2_07370 [Candidatus Heimdallarchaeota archaeon LC_2]